MLKSGGGGGGGGAGGGVRGGVGAGVRRWCIPGGSTGTGTGTASPEEKAVGLQILGASDSTSPDPH